MSLALIKRLIVGGSVVLALWAAWELANGSMALVALLSTAALAMVAHAAVRVRLDALCAGLTVAGFLIGNRGFAQLSPPNLPLFPAEVALGLGVLFTLWASAYQHRLPLARDPLNYALLAWLVLSTLRLPIDVRNHGILAVRDFAMIYYGVFFFLGQQWHEQREARRWLRGCLLLGLAVAPFMFEAFKRWPDIVMNVTQVRGIPLVFIKGDALSALMAGGAAWCACLATARHHRGYAALALLLLIGVLFSNSRAALVALAVIFVWLVLARAWRILRVSIVFAFGAVAVGLLVASLSRDPWHESEIYRAYERVASLADFSSTRTYRSSTLQDKGDNNEFRLTWWAVITEQTWKEDRWLGLGFGRELAAEFSRIYYPEVDETFTARSPHNFVLSVFARNGLIGLGSFLVVLFLFARSTWRAARTGVDDTLGLWLFAWGIFVSACFGVVLEGPMGAVIFWIVLGLASASSLARETEPDAAKENSATTDPTVVALADDRRLPAPAIAKQLPGLPEPTS